jgi:CRP-like cAMP-binding protein
MALRLLDLNANSLLAALPSAAKQALLPALERVELEVGRRLSLPNRAIRTAYFPGNGMISLVQTYSDGTTVEVGLIGNEGCWGTSLVLGAASLPMEAMVQGDGWAFAISADALLEIVAAHPEIRATLLHYAQFLHVQATFSAACNGRHKVNRRLARWLLEAADRMTGPKLVLSHEFISFMLGVRRAGVTEALKALKDHGLISTGRGHIEIHDRAKVEDGACECYRLVKNEYQKIFRRRPQRVT